MLEEQVFDVGTSGLSVLYLLSSSCHFRLGVVFEAEVADQRGPLVHSELRFLFCQALDRKSFDRQSLSALPFQHLSFPLFYVGSELLSILDDFMSDSFELGLDSHDVLASERVNSLVIVVSLVHFVGSAASSHEA